VGGGVVVLARQAAVGAPGKLRSTTAGRTPVPTTSAAAASTTSTSTGTSTSMSINTVAVVGGTMTIIRSRLSGRWRCRCGNLRRDRLDGEHRAGWLHASELRWHGVSAVRRHLV
jgi:hypothetical protein